MVSRRIDLRAPPPLHHLSNQNLPTRVPPACPLLSNSPCNLPGSMPTPEESANMIYNLLNEALSEDAKRRNAAESALRQAEERQDYFASLAQIAGASDEDATPFVRWLAAVCGKNATSRSWRRHTRRNSVTEDERQFVVDTLLKALGEAHSNISIQISLWITAIARIDFPRYWSTAILDICAQIRNTQPHVSRHALMTFDMTMKQLATRRLISDRMALYRYGPDAFTLLFELFASKVDQLIVTTAANQPENASASFEVIVYCLKSMRRIISHGCSDLNDLQSLNQLFVKIEAHPDLFLRAAAGGNDVQIRLSLLVAKLVRVTQQRHPVSFQPYLAGFLSVYYNTILSYDPKRSDDRTCEHIASFLTSCYHSPDYGINSSTLEEFSARRNISVDIPTGTTQQGCRNVVLSFFTEEVVNNVIQVMITKIFVLTPVELETWACDPELFVRDEEAAAEWGTESLRNQCEALFRSILSLQKDRYAQYIVNLAKTVPPSEPLLLDACYRAIGQTASDVYGVFDFDGWLAGAVGVLERTASTDLGTRVIQARTVWLVGQFVRYLTREARVKLYPSLVRLLSDIQLDRVIALTAAKTLAYLVDDFSFCGEDFAPFLPACIDSCFKLISASSSIDTKRDLLGAIANLVIASEASVIAPVAQQIVQYIPNLWNDCTPQLKRNTNEISQSATEGGNHQNEAQSELDWSNGESLICVSIVNMLTFIIQKSGDVVLTSDETRKIAMTILEFSIDTRPGMGGSQIMEEACELWLSVLNASTEYRDDLRQCFPHALTALNRDYEHLHKFFEVMKAYMLLGGELFMREFAEGIVQLLQNTIGNVRDRGLLATVDVVDLMLRAFPQEAVRVCADMLRTMLHSGTESGVVMGAYMALIGRAVLVNVGQMESEIFRGNEAICLEVIDLLLEYFDTMFRLPRRQVGALALIGLCGRYFNSPEVLKRIPGVLNCVVQVLSEEKRIHAKQRLEQIERNKPDGIIGPGGGSEENDPFSVFKHNASANPESHGMQRAKKLANQDTEVCMGVAQACMGLLMNLKQTNEAIYTQVLSGTDSKVLSQCEDLLKG